MAAWDLNLLLWTLLPAVWLWTGGHGATETKLPYPWLKENRSAKVITLECRPPSQTSDWTRVHSLDLSAFRPGRDMANNLTLALMTTTRDTPLKKDIGDIAQVNFTGSWDDPKTTVLTVVTPISSKDYGIYYCKGEYSDKWSDTYSFTTKIVVNDTLFSGHIPPHPVTVNNFRVSQKAAHEVTVTWRIPDAEDFVEATVSRTRGVAAKEEDWTAIEATRSLFTKSRADNMVYTSEVILHSFHCQEAANCSITLYVDAEKCNPACRYSCLVPYQACTGSQRQHCLCNQEGMTPLSESAGDNYKIEFQVTLVIFVVTLVCIVILVVLLWRFKPVCIRKMFTPTPEPESSPSVSFNKNTDKTPEVSSPEERKLLTEEDKAKEKTFPAGEKQSEKDSRDSDTAGPSSYSSQPSPPNQPSTSYGKGKSASNGKGKGKSAAAVTASTGASVGGECSQSAGASYPDRAATGIIADNDSSPDNAIDNVTRFDALEAQKLDITIKKV